MHRPRSEFPAFLIVAFTCALTATLGAVEDHDYLGINNGTGFNTAPDYVARSVETTKSLGFGSARVGMDGVGGESKGAAFRWDARDAAINAYRAAGVEVRTVVTPRGQIQHGANFDQWQANWEYFVRGVMEHYRGRIGYYIIDNEPELNYGQGTLNAAQAIAFTRIACKVSREIDPTVRLESPPANSPESDILRDMLQGGIAQYCDYIGTHLYGAQVNDGRAGKPWTWMEQYGVRKPLSASESGVTPRWVPKGFDGPGEEWRRRWLPQYYLSLKRYGFVHSMLFSLTDGENGWEFFNGRFEPNYAPTARELKDGFRVRRFVNGDFEAPNDREHEWQECYDPDRAVPPNLIDFHAGAAHTGQACASLDAGSAKSGQTVIARRIAGGLRPGAVYRLDAWVKITGATGRAHLKALGFDTLAGDRAVATEAARNGDWQAVALTVRPRASWLVVELSADGTGQPGDNVRWDDVALTETAAPSRPDAPRTLQTIVRPDEVMLTWDAVDGATHFRVKRADAAGGPYTVIADRATGSPWTDMNLKFEATYHYKVSAVNQAGESDDSPAAAARTAAGLLFVNKGPANGPVDLTAEGTLDWVHWGEGGAPGVARKATGGVPANLISDYKAYSPVQSFGDLPFRFSWTDGSRESSSSSNNGVYVFFPGNGLHLTVPADETMRCLQVHVGAFNARGKLVARLSDGSWPEYRDASFVSEPKGKFSAVYLINYRAANPGQRLDVAWVEDASLPGAEGNVQLQAAALSLVVK